MKHWLLVFSAFSLLIWGCNETLPVGSEILPNSDGQGNIFSDTTTLISSTVREDSLRTDKLFLSQLGYTNDGVFGKTKSSLLMGFRAPNISVSPSVLDTIGGYQLDSTVLSLTLNGIYGDSTKPMSFKVYKLLSPLSVDELYFSNIVFEQGMLEVGSIENYTPSLSNNFAEDSVSNGIQDYTGLASQLRIRLNPFFGQSIINLIANNQITSSELLQQVLPGLVVVPEEQDGSMIELDMLVNSVEANRRNALEDSRLHIFYKNSAGKSLNIMFPATVQDLGVNQYMHDYNATNIETALNSSDPLGDQVSYIQGLAGVKTKVEFPYIASYGNIAIQKAEIVVTQLPNSLEETFLPPERIFALNIGKDTIQENPLILVDVNENLSDFTNFSDAHAGGFGEMNNEGLFEYRINVSNFMQEVINGKKDNGEIQLNNGIFLTLYGAQNLDLATFNASDLIPHRIVIGGGNNTQSEYRLKLDMVYAILD